MAQQLAALAEGHLHQFLQHTPRPVPQAVACGTMRTTALSTRGGGSKLSGGTNSTLAMAYRHCSMTDSRP
jgi:hypothetical protein